MATSFWRDRSVLVTGATGLLGSWMVEELLARGARVCCLMRDWVPDSRLVSSGLLNRIAVVRGELEDYLLLVRALNEYEVDTVLHLGAQAIVGTAARSPLSTFEANIRGTWNLLEACRTCTGLVTRVVVASSDKAYGPQPELPYTESMPLQGRHPYEVSKSCADLIALSYFHTYGLPVAVTRCGNLFAGGDLNFNRLVPGTIRSALAGEAPIVRSDGRCVRDYFYAKDAVAAYLAVAERLPDGLAGEAFNFGSETPVSVLDLVDVILGVVGRTDLRPLVLNTASGEIDRQFLDCGKARQLLGWRPQFSLEEGLRETVAWYEAYLGTAARDAAHAGVAAAGRPEGQSA